MVKSLESFEWAETPLNQLDKNMEALKFYDAIKCETNFCFIFVSLTVKKAMTSFVMTDFNLIKTPFVTKPEMFWIYSHTRIKINHVIRLYSSQAEYNHKNSTDMKLTSGNDITRFKSPKKIKIRTWQNFKSAPLTSGPVQCWCCFQSQNVHRAALVYYKTTVLINHKTNRRTHTERPCP